MAAQGMGGRHHGEDRVDRWGGGCVIVALRHGVEFSHIGKSVFTGVVGGKANHKGRSEPINLAERRWMDFAAATEISREFIRARPFDHVS